MRHLKRIFPLVFTIFLVSVSHAQVYDTLITEHFDNTTNMSSSAGFGGSISSSTCGNANIFNVTTDSRALDCVHFETTSSVFVCSDKDAAGVGTGTVEVEMLTYTAVDNDEIGFVGQFGAYISNDTESADVVTVAYSTDNGSTYTDALVITGNGTSGLNHLSSGESFSCDDGSANIHQDMDTKEFSLGSNLSGQIIKIKVSFSGFTSGSEGILLDEFRLVKVRSILASEDFDGTGAMSTSSGVFDTPTESATCGSNSLYDCTSNMATPSNALNCLGAEDGDVFVMTGRPAGVAFVEELELLTYTATDNNEISFRGSFASFADDQNPDNFIIVSYSTDNGSTYTDAITFTGINIGTDYHSVSDGTPTIGRSFIKKGFTIGSNLNGSTIKIKVTFENYTNGGDGIAIDKFRLEGSLAIVLPIELADFSSQLVGDNVVVDWSTLSEINNDYFTVQRSIDATEFTDIGIVQGAGNSSELNNYQFIDDALYSQDVVYYRLKQTDYDGKTTYSKLQAVQLASIVKNEWSIFPNPAKNELHVEGEIAALSVMNLLGEHFRLDKGSSSSIDISELQNGTYIVKASFVDGSSEIKKLIINH